MDFIKIKDIFSSPDIDKTVTIGGWVRAFRAKKFIELNDGSTTVSYTHLRAHETS